MCYFSCDLLGSERLRAEQRSVPLLGCSAGHMAYRGFGAFWSILGQFLPALQLLGLSLGCAHGTVSGSETAERGQRREESG